MKERKKIFGKKGKLILVASAFASCVILAGGAYATWIFTDRATANGSGSIALAAAVNVTGCTVSSGTSVLNMVNATTIKWGTTTWTVTLAGNGLANATSANYDLTITNPVNAYVKLGGSAEATITTTATAMTKGTDTWTATYTLPTPTYVAAPTTYASYTAMSTAIAGKTITFAFTAKAVV
jgi:hypothetical protein